MSLTGPFHHEARPKRLFQGLPPIVFGDGRRTGRGRDGGYGAQEWGGTGVGGRELGGSGRGRAGGTAREMMQLSKNDLPEKADCYAAEGIDS